MTTKTLDAIELAKIRSRIERCNHLYHNYGTSPLTDHEFDELKAMLPAGDVLRTRHGAPIDRSQMRRAFKHPGLVGSLQNSMGEAEFRKWAENLGEDGYYMEDKADGMTIVLYFEAGKLVRAATRGDSDTGIGLDVTANAVLFQDVPTSLPVNYTGNVRGEAVLTVNDWHAIDPDEESNPRNLACGIVGRLDGVDSDKISFLAFGFSDPEQVGAETEIDQKGLLIDFGFQPVWGVLAATADEAVEVWNTRGLARSRLPIWVDGMVVKLNNLRRQQELGDASGCPRSMTAFKWQAEEGIGTLTGVTITTGHTGKLTITGIVDPPVRLGGTNVSNPAIHNWGNVREKDLHIGDKVVVYKAGEITPQVGRVHEEGQNRVRIDDPVKCPVCGGKVGHIVLSGGNESEDFYCFNIDCPAKAVGKIGRWIKSLDIKGIGDELLTALTSSYNSHGVKGGMPLVEDVVDLYRLRHRAEEFGSLLVNGRVLGHQRASTVLAEIDKTRTMTVEQFVGSLGVSGLGKRKAEMIREAAGSAEQLAHPMAWLSWEGRSYLMFNSDKLGIPGIASNLQRDLDAMVDQIKDLCEVISITHSERAAAVAGGRLAGLSFCLTGTMSRDRKLIAADIIAAGGEVKDKVSAGLSFLVQAKADSKSSKSDSAKKLGVKVIGEAELLEMMK